MKRRLNVMVQTWAPCLVIVVLHGAMLVAGEPGKQRVVLNTDEICDNQEAADAVMKARSFDPMTAQQANRDRDKAVFWYEKAISLQPGAKINALLANRIAQMYATYMNREKGVRPVPTKAAEWFTRCIEMTNPKQLLWGQAHIGLASAGVMRGEHYLDGGGSAISFYKRVLEMNPDEVELPVWTAWPEDRSDYRMMELARVRIRVRHIRVLVVEKIYYVASRTDRAAAIAEMQKIARDFKGTPPAKRAEELIQKALKAGPRIPATPQ